MASYQPLMHKFINNRQESLSINRKNCGNLARFAQLREKSLIIWVARCLYPFSPRNQILLSAVVV
jgi:hypothetical protein